MDIKEKIFTILKTINLQNFKHLSHWIIAITSSSDCFFTLPVSESHQNDDYNQESIKKERIILEFFLCV